MLNCVILMGNLVADPELKTTQNGLSLISFRIAVGRDYAKAGEERKTDFINVKAFGKTAEFIERYFHKGSSIAIQGSLQANNYDDKDGNKRVYYEVVVDRANFCGSKSDNTGGGSRIDEAVANAPAPSYATGNAGDFENITDDDLPF